MTSQIEIGIISHGKVIKTSISKLNLIYKEKKIFGIQLHKVNHLQKRKIKSRLISDCIAKISTRR